MLLNYPNGVQYILNINKVCSKNPLEHEILRKSITRCYSFFQIFLVSMLCFIHNRFQMAAQTEMQNYLIAVSMLLLFFGQEFCVLADLDQGGVAEPYLVGSESTLLAISCYRVQQFEISKLSPAISSSRLRQSSVVLFS